MAKKRATGATSAEGPGLIEQLREAIRQSGQSLNQLGKACGVQADRLSRFVRGERGLSLEAADMICRTLRLGLAPLEEATEQEEGE